MSQLNDKVAIVTGSGSGIGRAIALRFAAEGARVACLDISARSVLETVDLVESAGGVALAVETDISQREDVEKSRQIVQSRLGRTDIVINNAGVSESGNADTLSPEAWRRVLEVNLTGAFLVTKAFWSELIAARGAVVNNSSIMAMGGDLDSVAYCASKAALIGLTRALAADGARHGVRVNCVCPGFVDTLPFIDHFGAEGTSAPGRGEIARKIPLGRIATPEEIARAFLFLASSQSSYITGATLVVDGGATLGYKGSDV